MHLIRIGKSVVNLRYMIRADEIDDPPGWMRIMLESGIVQDVGPVDAHRLRRRLDELTSNVPPPAEAPRVQDAEEITPPAENPRGRQPTIRPLRTGQ